MYHEDAVFAPVIVDFIKDEREPSCLTSGPAAVQVAHTWTGERVDKTVEPKASERSVRTRRIGWVHDQLYAIFFRDWNEFLVGVANSFPVVFLFFRIRGNSSFFYAFPSIYIPAAVHSIVIFAHPLIDIVRETDSR